MPVTPPSLYGFAAGNVPYTSCALVLCTAALEAGSPLTLAELGEPAVAGYSRAVSGDLGGLFDELQIVPGRMVHFVSKMLDLHNASGSDANITGVALVIWTDPTSPLVMTIVPAPVVWRAARRIAGRLRMTAMIHDEGA